MGWEHSHHHEFIQGDRHYGEPDPELEFAGFKTINSRRVSLERIAPTVGSTFTYLYDFGDSWYHEIEVEAIIPTTARVRTSLCLDGARACPPEDVGSIPGYEEFCVAIADPAHPQHAELREWIGRPFDPEFLDLDAINLALQTVR
jgi:hypothetical protein